MPWHLLSMARGTALKLANSVIDLLTERRKKLNLSHEKLAALAGVHRTAISHIENRRRNPTMLICIKLAQAMELPLSEVFAQAEKIAK